MKYIIKRPKLLKFLVPIADRYVNLAGYRKLGLMYDDLVREESKEVQLAIKRLPPRVAYDRVYRIRRAMQLSMTHQLLPKDEWLKPEEDIPYLTPYIEEVEREIQERSTFDTMTKK